MRTKIRADRRVGLLLAGAIVLTFVAFGATIALPATDPSLEAKPRELTAKQKHGMEVYRAEGCWYCHTGYVRETSVDSKLGEPLDPKAYAGLAPSMLGAERDGGDLTHLDTRFANAAALIAYLEDPTKGRRRTSMPSYAFLSDTDLEALADYLLSR
jgi:cbb3-type cytochrome oxidase cytochrome c subunit